MSNQKSDDRFFASVLKRILVSLSCVSVIASMNLPLAFADDVTAAGAEAKSTTAGDATTITTDVTINGGAVPTASTVTTNSTNSSVTTAPSWSDAASTTVTETQAAATKTESKESQAAATKTESKESQAAATKTESTETQAAATKTESTGSQAAATKTESTETQAAASKTESTETPAAAAKTESSEAQTAVTKTEPSAAPETTGTEADPSAAPSAPDAKVDPTKVQSTVSEATGAADSAQLASVPMFGSVSTNEPIVVDNDEAVETESTIKYEELPTDEGKTHVKTGARFPVVISSQITTKTAKKGDPVEARLKYDLKIGDRLIAKKGAVVNGHINYSLPARSTMHSLVSPTRWYRNSGCVGISFDEIINDKGEHLPLVAVPARAARIVKNKGEGRELGINHEGQVTGPWSQQLRYKAIRIGLNAALAPAGAFSFGAMPVALGVIGAVNPSFAFMKPVGLNVRHRRIKGFFWGALSGVPGSWLIEDTVVKGQEAVIKPGDEFLAEFQQEFTGEPASEATMMPNAKSKVHGQVMPDDKKKKK